VRRIHGAYRARRVQHEARSVGAAGPGTSAAVRGMTTTRSRPEPRCPLRPADMCTQCVPGATGPQDCGLVWLVMGDDELRADLHERTVKAREEGRALR